jgi:hypothetical protein
MTFENAACSPAVRVGGDQGNAGQAAGGQVPEESLPPAEGGLLTGDDHGRMVPGGVL